jgi:long-chain fatty acid transport protein
MTRTNRLLLAGTALAALVLTAVEAQAGAFAIKEQSTTGLGEAFAGVAAGGAPSSMFWNPATMTQLRGMAFETDATAVWPNAVIVSSPFPGSTFGAGSPLGALPDPQQNVGINAFIPSAYITRQLTPDLWIGISANSPFGLATGFQSAWPGRFYGQESDFESYNVTPTVAYRVTNWLSVGAGFQAQYAKANLNFGLPVPSVTSSLLNLSGRGWGFGFTAGATITPWVGTEVGVGYRSFMDQKIGGAMTIPPLPFSTPGTIDSTLKLPDTVNGGIRQRVNDTFTLLGTVEWTHWSRIGTSTINSAFGPALALGRPVTLPFQYRDGWFFSGGVEYNWMPGWVLRAGGAYEISPITDQVRIPVLPDNNRIWLTGGVTKVLFPGLNFDLSYAHIIVDQTNIAVVPGNPWFNGIAVTGTTSPHIDIFSAGLRLQIAPPPPAPLITKG